MLRLFGQPQLLSHLICKHFFMMYINDMEKRIMVLQQKLGSLDKRGVLIQTLLDQINEIQKEKKLTTEKWQVIIILL